MPKIKILYNENLENNTFITEIKDQVREAVSQAISVDKFHIPPEEIDWQPIPLHPQADFESPITFEIETAGYPGRKHRLSTRRDAHEDPVEILANRIAKIPYIFANRRHFTVQIIFREEENRKVKR